LNGVGDVSGEDRVNVVGYGQGSRSRVESRSHGIDPHHSVALHDDRTALQNDALLCGRILAPKQIAPVDAIRSREEALAQPDLQSGLEVGGNGSLVSEIALHTVAERPVACPVYGSEDHDYGSNTLLVKLFVTPPWLSKGVMTVP